MTVRRLAAVAVVAAAGLVLGGCGATRPTASARGRAKAQPVIHTIVLDARFSAFSTNAIRVHPGEVVRFVLHNEDPIEHELIIGDESVQDYHEQGMDAYHDAPGAVSIPAGTTASTMYTFISPGTLLFGCHMPGHWAYGMHGTITVA